jgi:hypothetical protein
MSLQQLRKKCPLFPSAAFGEPMRPERRAAACTLHCSSLLSLYQKKEVLDEELRSIEATRGSDKDVKSWIDLENTFSSFE